MIFQDDIIRENIANVKTNTFKELAEFIETKNKIHQLYDDILDFSVYKTLEFCKNLLNTEVFQKHLTLGLSVCDSNTIKLSLVGNVAGNTGFLFIDISAKKYGFARYNVEKSVENFNIEMNNNKRLLNNKLDDLNENFFNLTYKEFKNKLLQRFIHDLSINGLATCLFFSKKDYIKWNKKTSMRIQEYTNSLLTIKNEQSMIETSYQDFTRYIKEVKHDLRLFLNENGLQEENIDIESESSEIILDLQRFYRLSQDKQLLLKLNRVNCNNLSMSDKI